jgi:diguanylate cyclase (GGDEF)-like protein
MADYVKTLAVTDAGKLTSARTLAILTVLAGLETGRVLSLQGTAIMVTVSCGVASLASAAPKCDSASLLAVADARLYRAKESGRNRVVAG